MRNLRFLLQGLPDCFYQVCSNACVCVCVCIYVCVCVECSVSVHVHVCVCVCVLIGSVYVVVCVHMCGCVWVCGCVCDRVQQQFYDCSSVLVQILRGTLTAFFPLARTLLDVSFLGLAKTIHTFGIYGISSREITNCPHCSKQSLLQLRYQYEIHWFLGWNSVLQVFYVAVNDSF
jgi:hypothetical protein